jgi:hypothetical protein
MGHPEIRALIRPLRSRNVFAFTSDEQFSSLRDASMSHESVGPSVVRSIKQRDLLNNWLRPFAKAQRVPLNDYNPDRLEGEKPELVYYDVDFANGLPRFEPILCLH